MNLLIYFFSINCIKLRIKISYKKYVYFITFLIFTFLITLPYISTNILIILVCFTKLTCIGLFQNLYINKLFKIFQSIFRFFLCTIMMNYFINENNCHKISISYIPFIYYLNIKSLICNKKFIYILCFYSVYYKIPKYLQKIIIIKAAYIILLHDISIFIRSETINQTLLLIYIKINRLQLNLYNISLLNIMISHQILEKIIEIIGNIFLSIKIKQNNISTQELIKNMKWYINKFFNHLIKNQNNINITLWIRLIKNKFKNKIYLD
uniref:hypothetical protein n=1 Tax=Echinothamnion hookeri TaxID=2008680 RepID=UPI002551DDF0|nr:hypothetical protein QQP88_pgp117 [Echinothamnion hookeri]WGH14343.1 hypothetical protein [Echinothamnion hookeri]